MKRRLYRVAALILSLGMTAGCGEKQPVEQIPMVAADYETDQEFLTVADGAPNPMDEDSVQLYADLGLNIFLLTEDYVTMVEDRTLSSSYQDSLRVLEEKGLKVWIRNMYNDPDYFSNGQEKTGSNYGAPYQLGEREITGEFADFPAVTGFYMSDEPYMTTLADDTATEYDESLFPAMDQYQKLVDWKNTYYPEAFWHMNQVPSASYDHYRGGYTYGDFIQYYVDNIVSLLESGGRSVCIDNYPLLEGGGTIRDTYLTDILTAANITRDYNAEAEEGKRADFGICLQTFQDTKAKLRDITSAEDVTFQMYTGMAAGARLFEYFTFRTYEGMGLYGITDSLGEKRIYDYVREANDRALPFSRVVCAFQWRGLTVSKGAEGGMDDTFGSVRELTLKELGELGSVQSRYDAVVGCFEQEGTDGYLVVNYTPPDAGLTNVVTLLFPQCSRVLVYTETEVEQRNLVGEGELRLTLAPGQAVFVIPD